MVQVSARAVMAFAAAPDVMPLVEAEVLARAVARWRASNEGREYAAQREADSRAGQEFVKLFGIGDARQWDPHTTWGQLTATTRLRAPIGRNPTSGRTVSLDLKEAIEGGMGPHGNVT